MLDPYIANFFCTIRHIPAEFEERLRKTNTHTRYTLEEYLKTTPSELKIKHAHPTEALLQFFLTRYHIPSTFRISSLNDNEFRKTFATHLFRCTALSMHETAEYAPDIIKFMPSFVIEWLPPCKNPSGCHRLCKSLCARMRVLQIADEIAKHNEAWKTLNDVMCHIDSHMQLLCSIKYTCSEDKCLEATFDSMLKKAEPDIRLSFTVENIPDTTMLIPLALVFNHMSTSNKLIIKQKFPHLNAYNIDILHHIVNIQYKLWPHRCNNREFDKLSKAACKNNRHMMEFMAKMIIASWLGVYENSHVKMPLMIRISVYHMFYTAINNDDMMSIFSTQNATVLMYMGKEYMQELLSRSPSSLGIISQVYDMGMYKKYNTIVNERTRQCIIENMRERKYNITSFDNIFSGIGATIMFMHEEYRKHQLESSVSYDVNTIMETCIDINYNRYECNRDDIIPGKEYLLPDPHPSLPDLCKDTMRECIHRFPKGNHIPMDWLVVFGVTAEEVNQMTVAVFGKLPTLERVLRGFSIATYTVFFQFFTLCQEYRMYSEIMGDVNMVAHHIAALANYHGIKQGEEIPPVAGKVQVCFNCGDVKHYSFYKRKVKNKNSNGNSKIMTTGDGVTVCACKEKPASWIKLLKNKYANIKRFKRDDEDHNDECSDDDDYDDCSDFDSDENETSLYDYNEMPMVLIEKKDTTQSALTANRKIAKNISMQKMRHRCNNTPTRTLNVFCRMAKFNDIYYVGCFDCLQKIEFKSVKYSGSKMLCDDCYIASISKSANGEHRCDYCEAIIDHTTSVDLELYDDNPKTPLEMQKYRTMYFCLKHGTLKWVKTYNIIRRRSNVIEGISKNWERWDPLTNTATPMFTNVSDINLFQLDCDIMIDDK